MPPAPSGAVFFWWDGRTRPPQWQPTPTGRCGGHPPKCYRPPTGFAFGARGRKPGQINPLLRGADSRKRHPPSVIFHRASRQSVRTDTDGMISRNAASDAYPVTPSDTAGNTFDSLYIGGSGNVTVDTARGTTVTFTGVVAGTVLPICVTRVRATGTTATSIVGLV